MFWECLPEWEGETVFIVAGGPSVRSQNLERLRGRRVIVINSSVHTVPWADMLFFGDARWWREEVNRKAIEAFKGEVVTTSNQVKSKVNLMIKKSPPGLSVDRRALLMKRTSLTGAINLAVHRGAGAIVLLGADGKAAPDGTTHHHKPHRWPSRAGCWEEQKKDLQSIVAPMARVGIKVINASPGSAWDLWPVMTLEEAIAAVDKDEVDFNSAALFVEMAKFAHERGDRAAFIANRKLALVALGVPDVAPPRR